MCPTGTALKRETRKRYDLLSAFEVMDVDRDGKISRDDLRTFYGGILGSTAGETSAEDVIGSMMLVADANKDGFIEYDEFEKVLSPMNGGKRSLGLMEDVFKAMDKDGDGKVGHEDLKSYLRSAGFEANDEDVFAMIRVGGGDEKADGVTYEGLLRILAV